MPYQLDSIRQGIIQWFGLHDLHLFQGLVVAHDQGGGDLLLIHGEGTHRQRRRGRLTLMSGAA